MTDLFQPQLSEEVADAIAGGRAVVALESTIISHGLPRPRNHEAAVEFEEMLRNGHFLQAPQEVGVVGQPTLLIDKLTVGGTAV